MTKLICSLLVAAAACYGQVALRSTTLAAAAAAGDRYVYVASATGIEVGHLLFTGQETMRVREIFGTRLTVTRGHEGFAQAHASGSRAYVDDRRYFSTKDRFGPCTASAEAVLPVVNIAQKRIFDCIAGVWTETRPGEVVTTQNTGAAGTGVTATEYGDGRTHVTQLSFSGLALGTAAQADLAFGKLLYTLPAGAIVVKSASYSIALAGAGETCDADTPDVGLGTVIGSGAVAVLGGTATFENILTGQTIADLAETVKNKTVADQVLVIEAAAAHTVHLNAADGWAGACAVTATGTVALEWVLLN
jgi:hypothetical protein